MKIDRKACQKEASGARRYQNGTKRKQNGTKKLKWSQKLPTWSYRVPKGSQKATEVHPKVALGAKVDFGNRKRGARVNFWILFGTFLVQKALNNQCKIRCRKNMKFHETTLKKRSPNQCHNSSKINAKTCNEKDQEIIKNHVSLKGKIIEIHWKNNVF